ncbi:hypothetical protein Hanom_Chr17g01582121 [Helianthus anomalus]
MCVYIYIYMYIYIYNRVNYKFCLLCLHQIAGGVLYLSKACTLCPLGQTQLDFLLKSDHVLCI